MSGYATTADLGRLTLPERTLVRFTNEEIQAQLDSASNRADSYLRSRFKLPLNAWGDDLRDAVCSIAAFKLVSKDGFNPEGDPTLEKNADVALRWLAQVAAGMATPALIEDSSGGAAPRAPLVLSLPRRGW